MRSIDKPIIVQALGLACVPDPDTPASDPALGRRPVAAAVVTLQQRDDGHREIVGWPLSDARAQQSPLPWLIDQALAPRAPTIITCQDRATLSIDAMARGLWAESGLAAVCMGRNAVDPLVLHDEGSVGGGSLGDDEAALCHRLNIPMPPVEDADVERTWSRDRPERAMDAALGQAAGRLMLWAHGQSFVSSRPDAFFETLLPLRDWMLDEERKWPSLGMLARSIPVARAASFASDYRAYRDARDAGDLQVRWSGIEGGLFRG